MNKDIDEERKDTLRTALRKFWIDHQLDGRQRIIKAFNKFNAKTLSELRVSDYNRVYTMLRQGKI